MKLDPFKHDDPFRVAPPYQAPGEIEPEIISDAIATRIIYESIDTNDGAYGKDADELCDWLLDAILNDESAFRDMLHRCKDMDVIQSTCGEIANDWNDPNG